MPNDYFRFKQFTVRQNRCAMKVTTDACIFGAWVPISEEAVRVLDVGTGTGLLALMIAQRFPNTQVDALELADAAAGQAQENVAASPFAKRIAVYHADARTFFPADNARYDALICNPPFFSKGMTGPSQYRAMARHDGGLTFDDLQEMFDRVLKPDGIACVLLPAARMRQWMACGVVRGWHMTRFCALWSHAGDRNGRAFFMMRRVAEPLSTSHLFTYDAPGGRLTPEVEELLRPFYFKL